MNEKVRYDRDEADSLVAIARTRRTLRAEAGRVALGDDQLIDRLGAQLEAAQDLIAELQRADPLRDAFDRLRKTHRSGPSERAKDTFARMHAASEAARRRSERDLLRWEDDGGP